MSAGSMRGVDAMRCMACGAEMHLIDVVEDGTMLVPGYEHHKLVCSACGDIEQRFVFRQVGASHAKSESVHSVPPILPARTNQDERIIPSGIFRPVFAKLSGVCDIVGRRLFFSQGKTAGFTELASVAAILDTLAPPADPVSQPPLERESVPETPSLRPVEAPSVPTEPPTSISDGDLDVCEALLKRAIEMVRGPTRSSQTTTTTTTTSVTEARSGAPSKLVSSVRADRPPASPIVVQIDHDPQKAKYVAKDTKSGLSILRHEDRTRLRAMCHRMGWQVLDGAVASAGD
jgi:hypothetical protein